MIRDFDLIRKMLLEIQAMPAGSETFTLSYPEEFPQSVVDEHASILIDAGLIEGKVLRKAMGKIAAVNIRGLTWAGHDFIDAAKNESIWGKAFAFVKEKGGAVTFEVLKELLKVLARDAAGLP